MFLVWNFFRIVSCLDDLVSHWLTQVSLFSQWLPSQAAAASQFLFLFLLVLFLVHFGTRWPLGGLFLSSWWNWFPLLLSSILLVGAHFFFKENSFFRLDWSQLGSNEECGCSFLFHSFGSAVFHHFLAHFVSDFRITGWRRFFDPFLFLVYVFSHCISIVWK